MNELNDLTKKTLEESTEGLKKYDFADELFKELDDVQLDIEWEE